MDADMCLAGSEATLPDLSSLLRKTLPLEPYPVMRPGDGPTEAFERRRALDRECGEVTAAILTVAGSRTSRVIVCNLRRPQVVVDALRGMAAELALELILLARPDGAGLDIAVQPH